MALFQWSRLYFYLALVALMRVHADRENKFYSSTRMVFYDFPSGAPSMSFQLWSRHTGSEVNNFTCWNLPEVYSNNRTEGNHTEDGLPLYVLDGISYTRFADNGDGLHYTGRYNTSRLHTQWRLLQSPLQKDANNRSGPVQVNVYSDSNCRNSTYPYSALSCEHSRGGSLEGWAAKSISFQPNCVNACFNDVPNGVQEYADQNGAGAYACLSTIAIGAAIAAGVVAVL